MSQIIFSLVTGDTTELDWTDAVAEWSDTPTKPTRKLPEEVGEVIYQLLSLPEVR